MARMTREEEEQLWKDLENDGFLPITVKTLPECAKYEGVRIHHKKVYEAWRGASGKCYWIKKKW